MPGDVVQAQYEQLDDVARRFERQAEAARKVIEQVRRSIFCSYRCVKQSKKPSLRGDNLYGG